MDATSYNYESMKPAMLTDDGQRLFLRVRDRVKELCLATGAIRLREAVRGHTGELWELMACVDRMVEIGELVEVAPGRFSGDKRFFALPE